jgi:hypothetical protein
MEVMWMSEDAMSMDDTDRDELEKPLSDSDAIEGECTKCGDVRRVWPVEYPADIALELEWGYARLCLDCWREMGQFFNSGADESERSPQQEWEAHNKSFEYEPPEKPGDAWSSEEYQELYDRVISRRIEWLCDRCTGRGPFRSLKKARQHVQSQHGTYLIEKHETPRDELEAATDGGTSKDQTEKRTEENHGLGDFSGGDA